MNAEMDTDPAELNMKLLARLRLQRHVFAACTLVLFLLGSVGLSAWRTLKKERDQSEQVAATQKNRADEEAANARQTDLKLRQTSDEYVELGHQHSSALLHLAVTDIAEGRVAAARAKYRQATMLQSPAWAPVVRSLFPRQPPRYGLENAVSAAVDYGSQYLLAACETDKGLLLKLLDANSARLLDQRMLPGQAPDCEIFWWRGSDEGILRLGKSAQEFVIHDSRIVMLDKQTQWPNGEAVFSDGRTISVHHMDELFVIQRTTRDKAQTGVIPLRGAAGIVYSAFSLSDGGVIYVDDQGVKRLVNESVTTIAKLAFQPTRATLFQSGELVLAGLTDGRQVQFLSTTIGASSEAKSRTVKFAQADKGVLKFLRDGTLVVSGKRGKTMLLAPTTANEITLGESPARLISWHPHGILFASTKTDLNLRRLAPPLWGKRLAVLPADVQTRATPHGFVCTSTNGGRSIFRSAGGFEQIAPSASVHPTTSGVLTINGNVLRLPDGKTIESSGEFLGVSQTGRLLLWHNRLLLRNETGETTGVDSVLAKRPELFASSDRLAAICLSDKVVVSHFGLNTETVDLPQGLRPTAVAASNNGFAVQSGLTTVVWAKERMQAVTTSFAPTQIALLFDSSVLATTNGSSLALTEVSSGRVIWAVEMPIESMAVTSSNSLLVAGRGELREIGFVR
ncbi:MAG: hypothetical protein ACYTDT_02055 [Planctomycetota bacterium]|jgi:hypothetical protein